MALLGSNKKLIVTVVNSRLFVNKIEVEFVFCLYNCYG